MMKVKSSKLQSLANKLYIHYLVIIIIIMAFFAGWTILEGLRASRRTAPKSDSLVITKHVCLGSGG